MGKFSISKTVEAKYSRSWAWGSVYVLHVSSRACFLFFFFFSTSRFVRVRLAACKVVNEEAVSFISAVFSKDLNLYRSRISFVAL